MYEGLAGAMQTLARLTGTDSYRLAHTRAAQQNSGRW
jgi:hypothetical protein